MNISKKDKYLEVTKVGKYQHKLFNEYFIAENGLAKVKVSRNGFCIWLQANEFNIIK